MQQCIGAFSVYSNAGGDLDVMVRSGSGRVFIETSPIVGFERVRVKGGLRLTTRNSIFYSRVGQIAIFSHCHP